MRKLTPQREALALEAKNLREFGYTQQEIADALVVPQQTVDYWLSILGKPTSGKTGKRGTLPTFPLTALPTIDVTLYPCRYEDAGGSIPDKSIDLILTDPPYLVSNNDITRIKKYRLPATRTAEYICQCPHCLTLETLWVKNKILVPTIKFHQTEDGAIYHDCNSGSARPCRLFPNWEVKPHAL